MKYPGISVMYLPQGTIKSVLMFRIYKLDQQSIREPSSLSIPASVLKWFHRPILHFRCIPFREIFFWISWLVLATSIRRICLWNSLVDDRESAIVNFAVACWNWYLICISICNKSLLIQWLGRIHIILYNLILPIQYHKILSRLVSPRKIHKRLRTHL